MPTPRKRTQPVLTRAKGIVVNVPDDLKKAHVVVKQTMAGFRGLQPDSYGMVRCDCRPGISICVSRKQVRRAMRIADGVLTAVETRGHKVVLTQDEDRSVQLHVNGAVLGFEIHETLGNVPTRIDREGNQLYRSGPTGSLSLRIFARSGYHSYVRTHRDGRTFPLESRLALAIADLESIAAWASIKQQEEREIEHRRQQAKRRSEMQEKLVNRRMVLRDALKIVLERAQLVDSARALLQQLEREAQVHRTRHLSELTDWIRFAISRLGSPKRLNFLIPEAARELARQALIGCQSAVDSPSTEKPE